MKKVIICIFLFVYSSYAQEDIFKHIWWEAVGSYDNQHFGDSGLDTIGKLNDTVLHAISIGESDSGGDISSRLVNNQDKIIADTSTQGRFPGATITVGDINGDGIKDYVVQYGRTITVLFGKDSLGKFDTAMVLHGDPYHEEFENTHIVVGKFDSSNYDGIVISDANYSIQGGTITLGRLLYYHGGMKLDSASADVVMGDTGGRTVGGLLAVGHIRDTSKEYLIEARIHHDSANIVLYPYGQNFVLNPSDTFTINWNSDTTGDFSGGYLIVDADGDSIDDIFWGCTNTVIVYKGRKTILPQWSYQFKKPFLTNSDQYGSKVVNLGFINSPYYQTIAVTDPGGSYNGFQNGVVFLFNLGEARTGISTANGSGPVGYKDNFGSTVIAPGNANGFGQHSFMVGRTEGNISTAHGGALTAFWGDTSYGPMVGVREDGSIPVVFSLAQNYPNPVSGETHIDFSILDSRLYGSSAMLALYNEFGEQIETLYRGTADNIIRSLHFNVEDLPSGNYFYRITCGGREETKMLTKIK